MTYAETEQKTVYDYIKQSSCEAIDARLALKMSHEDIYTALVSLEARGKVALACHHNGTYRVWRAA